MANDSSTLRQLACFLGASGVGLGAFGAHALKERLLSKSGASENWRTAVTYQLLHAVALLSLSSLVSNRPPHLKSPSYSGGQLMALGTAMFSGSIYLLCLDIGPKKLLGPLTPIGGLMMISGWVLVGTGKF
ncbi:hypothetical protein HJC23_012316 [Cyclotella cryptica]|uniref:DUF423-domain-containing protein n=1 Tax=Cyclotella cryptica TaxID=29204 RepID=A0ABD3QCY9_9STRA|eukprot:CCRYP_006507-RA/>CCRYP_006507-RA protein AED:0.02 eAED:0.02 QI:131/1/1/1/0.5/0.33/3/2045/130